MTSGATGADVLDEAVTLVPETVGAGEEQLEVDRAWPSDRTDEQGRRLLVLEGRDSRGRVRAARAWMCPTPAGGRRVGDVTVLPAGQDAKLPDLPAWADEGTVVVHRFGKRAVVATGDSYVKVVRRQAATRVVQQAGQGYLLAQAAGIDAPRVTGLGPGWVQCSVLSGRSWHDWGIDGMGAEAWSRSWRTWAQRWPLLVTHDAEVAGMSEYTGRDEGATLSRWTAAVREWSMLPPALEEVVLERADAVSALLEQPGQPLVVAHRDLHDKQMLVDAATGRLGLLDFDTAAWAEPALDLANLAVHVQWRVAQGLWAPERADVALAEISRVRSALGVSADRFEAYAESTRVRLACIYLFRPRYRQLALRWVAQQHR